MVEKVIKTFSKNIETKCKKCKYEGTITATRQYYIDCPECNEMIYVGHLTK